MRSFWRLNIFSILKMFLRTKYNSANTWRHSFWQDSFACIQGSIWPIHKWYEWFVTCVQTSNPLLSINQPHLLFLGRVLVFEKWIVLLQKVVSMPGESFHQWKWTTSFNRHTYGTDAMMRSKIFKWWKEFCNEWTMIEHAKVSGGPWAVRTETPVNTLATLIRMTTC